MKSIIENHVEAGPAGEEASSGGHWALASLALSMLLSSLGVSIANVALPTLAKAFEASFQEVQWIVLAYLLASTMLIVSVGRLGDMLGHWRVLLAGITLFTVASLLCGLAPNLPVLIAARAVQGLGAAILMALTVALVRETVEKARTGRAMGLLGTMSAVGTALGPSLGGLLLSGPGWQAIFLAMVPLGVLNFLLAYRHVPGGKGEAEKHGRGFDSIGTLFLGLALAAYALAMTVGRGHFDRSNVVMLMVAISGAGLFVLAEAKVASPLIHLSAFRDRALSASLAMNALVSTVMMATLVVGPFYLARRLELSDAMVGATMSAGPIISALSGIPAGRIVERFSASVTVVAGLVAMVAGAAALSLLPEVMGIAGYVVAIAVLTPGYQLFQAANNTAVMMNVDAQQRGVISGLLSLSRNLGLITGASVMGAIFALASGTSDITAAAPAAIADGMRVTFVVAAALIAIATAIALIGRLRTPRQSSPDART